MPRARNRRAVPQSPDLTRERSRSTGGQAPIRVILDYIVEHIPSHDGKPFFTAWIRRSYPNPPPYKPWSTLACDNSDREYVDSTRPLLSILFYDITPGSDNHDHLKALAESLYRETHELCELPDRDQYIRTEVCGMPLPAGLSDKEKAAKCKAHAMAEIASRKAGGAGLDLQITPIIDEVFHIDEYFIFVIDKPRENWNEDEGGVLEINWDMNGGQLPEGRTTRLTPDEFERSMSLMGQRLEIREA
ncbi:hypothetical protein CSUB01_07540 [Colletotrichum sublineola]|uniref:Uncharacterized protein n=1 Tax=Colletotrichum sublineola TaxID=1173701 RepID=A0A066XL83_COLSU|nr:hypothetical protein CSUB01_07540 [Colletotrichum sublineola]